MHEAHSAVDNIKTTTCTCMFGEVSVVFPHIEYFRVSASPNTGDTEKDDYSVSIKTIYDLDRLASSLNSAFSVNDERLIWTKDTAAYYELADLLKTIGDDSEGGYYVDFARYPEKEPDKPYVFVLYDKFEFNLEELKAVIDDGCQFRDGLYWLLQEGADAVRCMKSNLAHEFNA